MRRLVEESDADVIITGDDLVRRLVQEYTDATLVAQKLHSPGRYSGTEIRTRIRHGRPWPFLVPDCCRDIVEAYVDAIKTSG